MKTKIYLNLWKKYLPIIRILLKKSLNNNEELQLNRMEFETVGGRDLSGYCFNLEIKNGKVSNDISGTAVARDLYQVLNNDKMLIEFFKERRIKFSMGRSFILKIGTI